MHIPFCPKVCPYCSFYKEASDRNKTRGFLDAVLAEAERHAWQLAPQTIFFGGGTPTALSTSQLEYLIGGLRERINFANLQEFTVEMNPATVSLEKAAALRRLGVNRVSMGVQSWDAGLLATLGRIHSASQAQRSYEILREAGFKNINLDLIFGVPGQTRDHWRASLEKNDRPRTQATSPPTASLTKKTPEYFLRMSRGEYRPDETLDADLFEMTIDTLEDAGFCQYEISNYSRPGRECRHNLAYWLGADFLGLGPSAFSTVGFDRWKNVSDTSAYVCALEGGGDPADFREDAHRLTPVESNASLSPCARTAACPRTFCLHPKPRHWPISGSWSERRTLAPYPQGQTFGRFRCGGVYLMAKACLRRKAAFCLWNADVPGRDQIRDWQGSRLPAGDYQWLSAIQSSRRIVSGAHSERMVTSVEGLVYASLTGEEWKRLIAFEDDFYELQEVIVECPETNVSALAFIVPTSRKVPPFRQDLEPRFLSIQRDRSEKIVCDATASPDRTRQQTKTCGLRGERVNENRDAQALLAGARRDGARGPQTCGSQFFQRRQYHSGYAW